MFRQTFFLFFWLRKIDVECYSALIEEVSLLSFYFFQKIAEYHSAPHKKEAHRNGEPLFEIIFNNLN